MRCSIGVVDKMRENKLRWFLHVMRWEQIVHRPHIVGRKVMEKKNGMCLFIIYDAFFFEWTT
jgi:hypothetical protein